ncbi:endonuclease VII [Streptomyces phage WRightOn]|uniref:Endonuclease VII n=1 Tax=Streptomyces phage WRightOn TaxID=2053723 RepID=A0A2H4PI29_9CAUD|nr:endonuclease VII [Streptomyces phage WRightOn]ATW62459.1 endonuclease VII [Streptomyces phage WRightOn]
MGKVTCTHCTAPFEARTPSAKFCPTCVPRDTKGGMKHRQNIALYGVDKFMYDAMYFEQDGECPICEEREAEVIDHCHKTGRVRGLLCRACNTMLGMIEDSKRLNKALDYVAEGVY